MTDATDCGAVTHAEKLVRDFLKANPNIQLHDFGVSPTVVVHPRSTLARIANTLVIFY
ncbi:MAG: hypothetical protein AAB562_03685 [Patescibacteria group bacterium]